MKVRVKTVLMELPRLCIDVMAKACKLSTFT
jgi:hypothetical protein